MLIGEHARDRQSLTIGWHAVKAIAVIRYGQAGPSVPVRLQTQGDPAASTLMHTVLDRVTDQFMGDPHQGIAQMGWALDVLEECLTAQRAGSLPA